MTATTQARFAEALADWTSPVPAGLRAWTGERPERRFSIYRNNVRAGLTAALASRFPASEAIVGPDFFAAMAAAYIAAHPPRSPLLMHYGDGFADFVSTFAPAAGLPYLPDVIRLEIARGHAYHAADAVPLAAETLAQVPAERLADLTFTPHPSLAVLRFAHPAVTIWAMNAGEAELAPVDDWTGEDAIIVRPAMTVEVHRLPPGAAAFFDALVRGLSLAEAADLAVRETDAFNLAAALATLLASGAFIDITIREENPCHIR